MKLTSFNSAIENTNLEFEYLFFQSLPVIGAVFSLPLGIYCACKLIDGLAQTIFLQYLSQQSKCRENIDKQFEKRKAEAWQNVADYAVLLFGNVANIATCGILNCAVTWYGVYLTLHAVTNQYSRRQRT